MWVKDDGECGLKDVRRYTFCIAMAALTVAVSKSLVSAGKVGCRAA
jgi:hypothetical protein